MTAFNIVFLFIFASTLGYPSNPTSGARSVSSHEYQIYSRLIHHVVEKYRLRQLWPCCSIVITDSTIHITDDDFPASPDSLLHLMQRIRVETLLTSCPDTFQVALIYNDYIEQNNRRYALDIDSIRHHLAFHSTSLASLTLNTYPRGRPKSVDTTHFADTCSHYAFTFSRCGFNPTLDQAQVKFMYEIKQTRLKHSSFFIHEAYFIRKGLDWQLVQDNYLATGHMDYR
jgi:hypothetical protein